MTMLVHARGTRVVDNTLTELAELLIRKPGHSVQERLGCVRHAAGSSAVVRLPPVHLHQTGRRGPCQDQTYTFPDNEPLGIVSGPILLCSTSSGPGSGSIK